jgi:nitrite reductase/ring-hydroxylating ferredoxin subunit/uncharacterized membrane protein
MTDPEQPRSIDRFADALEGAVGIDRLAIPLNRMAGRLLGSGQRSRSLLPGTALGHPLHPMLVTGPLGCWVGAFAADLLGEPRAARKLTGAGVLLAGPAIATGLSDWAETTGAERRTGFVHLTANTVALALYFSSWRARRNGSHLKGVALGALGAAAASSAGWLGGHLAYGMGVGVDTTAFDGGPDEWTLVVRDPENPRSGSVAGVALVIIEDGGQTYVLADRCTHRGGPLSEGSIVDGCVVCPWHCSRFSLVTGTVVAGPAVARQPTYESRQGAEGLFVRRREQRSLRTNPV